MYEVMKANKAPEFFEELRTGEIVLRNQCVKIENFKEGQIYDHQWLQYPELKEFPTIMYVSGLHIQDLSSMLRIVEEKLYTLGILSIDEIGMSWLKWPNMRSYSANILFVFPIYFQQVDLPRLEGNRFYLTFRLHKNIKD